MLRRRHSPEAQGQARTGLTLPLIGSSPDKRTICPSGWAAFVLLCLRGGPSPPSQSSQAASEYPLWSPQDDGAIRVWKNFADLEKNPEMVTAWQGLSDMLPTTRGGCSPGSCRRSVHSDSPGDDPASLLLGRLCSRVEVLPSSDQPTAPVLGWKLVLLVRAWPRQGLGLHSVPLVPE